MGTWEGTTLYYRDTSGYSILSLFYRDIGIFFVVSIIGTHRTILCCLSIIVGTHGTILSSLLLEGHQRQAAACTPGASYCCASCRHCSPYPSRCIVLLYFMQILFTRWNGRQLLFVIGTIRCSLLFYQCN